LPLEILFFAAAAAICAYLNHPIAVIHSYFAMVQS